MHSEAFLSVSGAFMQFAVILHECFKCHTCYSTSIKVGWMANTLSSQEMFYSGSPGIIDTEVTSIHLCMYTYRKHTHCEQDYSAYASPDTNKYTFDRICAHAVAQGWFCLFICGINRQLEKLLC